jgi:hypothetical protein
MEADNKDKATATSLTSTRKEAGNPHGIELLDAKHER